MISIYASFSVFLMLSLASLKKEGYFPLFFPTLLFNAFGIDNPFWDAFHKIFLILPLGRLLPFELWLIS